MRRNNAEQGQLDKKKKTKIKLKQLTKFVFLFNEQSVFV